MLNMPPVVVIVNLWIGWILLFGVSHLYSSIVVEVMHIAMVSMAWFEELNLTDSIVVLNIDVPIINPIERYFNVASAESF